MGREDECKGGLHDPTRDDPRSRICQEFGHCLSLKSWE